jgi:hypothetical protein
MTTRDVYDHHMRNELDGDLAILTFYSTTPTPTADRS